ncbi:MAG: hypothetical protein AVDCRST_MAG13-623, partial [uncultured Solirubrobacteraceae bacterium]
GPRPLQPRRRGVHGGRRLARLRRPVPALRARGRRRVGGLPRRPPPPDHLRGAARDGRRAGQRGLDRRRPARVRRARGGVGGPGARGGILGAHLRRRGPGPRAPRARLRRRGGRAAHPPAPPAHGVLDAPRAPRVRARGRRV